MKIGSTKKYYRSAMFCTVSVYSVLYYIVYIAIHIYIYIKYNTDFQPVCTDAHCTADSALNCWLSKHKLARVPGWNKWRGSEIILRGFEIFYHSFEEL